MVKLINQTDKFFVAGHNGMVGKAICRCLIKNGYSNILKADRNELDLEDKIKVEKWINKNKPDIVILAAAKVGGIKANFKYPVDFLLRNLKIQNNVIESSYINNVKRFLFLGTSSIYPKFAKQPIKEEELLTGLLEPTNESYALAKIAGIKLCDAYRNQYNFDAISLMPTNLYGPGDNYSEENSHVLPSFIRRFYNAKINNSPEVNCWGSGRVFRELLHVDDLGDACVHVLEKWNPSENEPTFLNVGTGLDISIRDLAKITAQAIGYEGEIKWDTSKPDGAPKKQLDVKRINDLGWEYKIKLKDGIINTVKDYKKYFHKDMIRK